MKCVILPSIPRLPARQSNTIRSSPKRPKFKCFLESNNGLNGNGEDGELKKIDSGRQVSDEWNIIRFSAAGKTWKKLRVVDNRILGYKLHTYSHTLHPALRYVKVWVFRGAEAVPLRVCLGNSTNGPRYYQHTSKRYC